MAGCEEFRKFCDEEIGHCPEYKDSWDDIDEDVQNTMPDEEVETYYVDPAGERKFEENIDRKKCLHMIQCVDERCKSLRKLWEGEPILAEKLARYGKPRRDAQWLNRIIGGMYNGIKVDDWNSTCVMRAEATWITLKRGDEKHVFMVTVTEKYGEGETPDGDEPQAVNTAQTRRC